MSGTQTEMTQEENFEIIDLDIWKINPPSYRR